MANYSAAEVKRLRELTGAGMMDCKRALEENDGDIDKSIEALRISGQAKVAKRGAERRAENGLVATSGGALIELNCETDFVAKNADFEELADRIVGAAAAERPADLEALKALLLANGRTVLEEIESMAGVIGEKLELTKYAVLDGDVAVYLHRRSNDLPPQVGVLVAYAGSEDVARIVGMQIAAMRPTFVTRDEVPTDVVDSERRIAEATAREEGKPDAALPKIIEGRVNGFFKESVLLEQAFVQDSKSTVQAYLDGAGTTVTAFARFEVGKG
jgi:elongation factor Ts